MLDQVCLYLKMYQALKFSAKPIKHGRSGYPGHMTRVQRRWGEPIPADSRGAARAKTWIEKEQQFIQ